MWLDLWGCLLAAPLRRVHRLAALACTRKGDRSPLTESEQLEVRSARFESGLLMPIEQVEQRQIGTTLCVWTIASSFYDTLSVRAEQGGSAERSLR